VWEADDKTLALYEIAGTLAQLLGFDLPHQSSGGAWVTFAVHGAAGLRTSLN
jgi:hypothetical protein